MDYKKHYDELIERSLERTLTGYVERHHIIPRSLGGSDSTDNIVKLTAEEHYVAHQLLVKMYPSNSGLVWAAIRMTGHKNNQRTNNKIYGWLRRRYQQTAKQRTGDKNGSYGRPWFYNPSTLENGKYVPGSEPEGWIRGRKPKNPLNPKNPKITCCQRCGNSTGKQTASWCDNCRSTRKNQRNVKKQNQVIQTLKQLEHKHPIKHGQIVVNRHFVIDAAKEGINIHQILKYLGCDTATGGNYKTIQNILSVWPSG